MAIDKSNKVVDLKISNDEMNLKPTFFDVTIVNALEDDRDIEYNATDRAEILEKNRNNSSGYAPCGYRYEIFVFIGTTLLNSCRLLFKIISLEIN